MRRVFVTGGAGFVGSALVPKLLSNGYRVTVLDLYLYGEDVFGSLAGSEDLRQVKGDLRDEALLRRELEGIDAVIHLACISNDPSYELDPALGKSINYDAMRRLVDLSKEAGVRRFVYASSSSVYGVKNDPEVTEDLPLEPLTDYSKYKALGEDYLLERADSRFVALVLRPATVCGYAPRLRLDLVVNIFTNHALTSRKITVFGGAQKRPNLHIDDMTDCYLSSLEWPDKLIASQVFNVGADNYTLDQIAETVKRVVADPALEIVHQPTQDPRSYHISSAKIRKVLGFVPKRTVETAVADLKRAYQEGKVRDPLTNKRYYNIKTMQAVSLV